MDSIDDSRRPLFVTTLPKHTYAPTQVPEIIERQYVPSSIALELGSPKRLIRLRPLEVLALMPMPKASVNEDYCVVLWKYKIRLSRQ